MSNKTLLRSVFDQLITEISPQRLIEEQCGLKGDILRVADTSYDLSRYNNIYLLGSGKAVLPMTQAIQRLLKERIFYTLIVGAYPLNEEIEKTEYIRSTHPLPSSKSLSAAAALKEALLSFDGDDLFIYLLSGGNSALVELPEEEISLEEFQEATSLMLHGGMPIDAINCVRKHLSAVKGGKLAALTKAEGVVLVLSDVIGDDLYTIGSAPLYYDTTSYKDAIEQLEAHSLFEKMPSSVQRFLIEGEEGLHDETPKEEHKHIHHHILGSNRIVLQKAQMLLQGCGVEASIIEKPIQGDVSDIAQEMLALAYTPLQKRHCYILGGEATVVVKGKGSGGRNQHLCLSLLQLLKGDIDITFLSAATDGIDGNSKAAGALIDLHSCANAQLKHLNIEHYLESFDSNSFFTRSDELLVPGPTHNNLLDIVMMLIEPRAEQGEGNG